MTRSFLRRYRPGGRLNDPGQMVLSSLGGVGGVDSVVQEANMSKLTRVVLDDPDLARLWLDEQVAESRMLPEGILFSANVRVSPEVARYILDHHNKPRVVQDGNGDQEELRNRSIRMAKINELKRIVREGRWQVLAQGVSFSRDGRLNNGQHRLRVISEEGVSLNMYFTFGESREAFHATDTPGVRDGSDTLTIAGYKYGTTLSAAAKMLNNLQKEGAVTFRKLLNEEVLSLIDQEPSLEGFASSGSKIAGPLNASPTAVTVALYLISRDTKAGSYLPRFIQLLEDGLGAVTRDKGVVKLRTLLTGKAVDAHIKHGAWKPYAQSAAIIKTWNLWRKGKVGMPGELTWNVGDKYPTAE